MIESSAPHHEFFQRIVEYESLWSQPGGWDYVTEENAAHVIALLPELVEYLIGLKERAVPRR